MDSKLESLKKSILNSWFPETTELFPRKDAADTSELLDLLIEDSLEIFKTSCPILRVKVYQDFLSLPTVDENRQLFILDIDPDIIRVLGIYNSDTIPADVVSRIDSLTGRDTVTTVSSGTSPYISEQIAIDLYRHLDVDQWSGRMTRPITLTDDIGEYMLPSAENFLVFYLAERDINVDSIPSNIYKTLEPFISYSISDMVLNSFGRFPVTLQLDKILNRRDEIDPSRLTEITISGKIKIKVDPPDDSEETQTSDLFDSGSAKEYLENLADIRDSAKLLFETLKYIDLGGISLG